MPKPLDQYEIARDGLVAELGALGSLLPAPHEGLQAAKARLERGKFVLAVVGEFSSGKSFLLNALLEKFHYVDANGTKQLVGLLATDINPTTATITELEYAPYTEATAIFEDRSRERIPLDRLNRFIAVGSGDAGTLHDATKDETKAPVRVIVQTDSPFLQRGFLVADTPGLASINPAHRRATLGFLPSADAVLYLIDTQQPFTEGDAAFLGIIRKQIDSIFIVQTKIDLWQEKQSDGKAAWEHAYDRITSLAAVHAPGTHVYAVSAREYAEGHSNESRFPQFLAALDASLIRRTGYARLRRAHEQARLASDAAIARIDADRAMLALDAAALQERRAGLIPELDVLDARVEETVAAIETEKEARASIIQRQGEALLDEIEQRLLQAFDTADIARLRDRARLHILVDRTVAEGVGDFAERIATESISELDANLARADRAFNESTQPAGSERITLPFSLPDEAARAFNGEPGTHVWSGNIDDAISGTIVLDAIGGPSVSLVYAIAQRFASSPSGQYMKRELLADLRNEIFPRFRDELQCFIRTSSVRIAAIYAALAVSLQQSAKYAREARIGSIDHALAAHAAKTSDTLNASLAQQRAAITGAFMRIAKTVDAFVASEETAPLEDSSSREVRIAHATANRIEATLDATTYQHGLQPQRWRVAVLGALRRGKSSLINAFAGEPILTDDVAGSARYPIHVRYGDRNAAYTLSGTDAWQEIPPDRAIAAAAESPVLRLTPWKQPRELVLVHAPAFDSGETHAEDINMVVAAQASTILCLFSRQLSDRELSLYERIAELGKPISFVHTIADNETAKERRNVVALAAHYLKERNIPATRIFTISAHEYTQAQREHRAPAGWNELGALISTIEGQAETHMTRLARLEHAASEDANPAVPSGSKQQSKPPPSNSGFFARLRRAWTR